MKLHHRIDGPSGAPLLVLGPSLGTTLDVWRPLLSRLTRSYRVLRYDLPGHGLSPSPTALPTGNPAPLTKDPALPTAKPAHPHETTHPNPRPSTTSPNTSDLPEPGTGISPTETDQRPAQTDQRPAEAAGLSVEEIAGAVLELVEDERFVVGGISLGGAVAAAIAARVPERVTGLVLCCTSAWFGEPGPWLDRAALVRREGVRVLAPALAERWFTNGFDSGWVLDMLDQVDPEGYAACCEALAAFDLRDRLPTIKAPTLVIAGSDDPATPLDHSLTLTKAIPNATLTVLPGSAHLAPVQHPEEATRAILTFLQYDQPSIIPTPPTHTTDADAPRSGDAVSSVSAGDDPRSLGVGDERWVAGMRTRREVLGDEHVDRAVAATTPFTADFQEMITRYAWDGIWNRPGLDRRTRSCVTITALVARGHLEELAMHVRSALRNGLTPDEIKEVLLQTAVYCGVPAANSAFAIAQRVLAEYAADKPNPA
ncbi:bifunctional 3-oxoadipate enol-lactonase/4-carboxymuconolactone decarboxylase PcaDC [Nonomuraea sediminis]|uniref:bifunctional 3-oxoadipate enol-lactonase/4-carboxymuconolactone decarboxylase PcaDC n=1 Tax=Nonomuraea sediminis TaxID=2835864 RepID=UPI001BDCEDF9|nr:4-carboxymuconolactone decarboxylase [Nonomuraea sediminis]